MKIQWNIILMLALSLSGFAQAQEFSSAFGFTSQITDNWLIVNQETVSKNPELLNFDNAALKKMDPALISKIKKMALAGKIELLYFKNSDIDFYDNMNVFVSYKNASNLQNIAKTVCPVLPQQIKEAYKRQENTNTYYCKQDKVYDTDVVTYSFDGSIPGTTSFGYYFNTKNNTLTLTVTCKNEKCSAVKSDAEKIFKQLQLH